MENRKLLRRLQLLMYKTPVFYMFKNIEDLQKLESHFKPNFIEIANIVIELGLDFDATMLEWREKQQLRWDNKSQYSRRPIKIRKDNKTEHVGSGGSNKNKVRRPRKCRKTAWKRFYKLFPRLKPNE